MKTATLIHAWYFEGVWRCEASSGQYSGFGRGATAQEAIDTANEDLKWLQPTAWPSSERPS